MLHNDNRVSQVAEAFEGVYEPNVVALVQPDTGFVKDIQYIDQLRPYLRGQPYALTLTARQCGRSS